MKSVFFRQIAALLAITMLFPALSRAAFGLKPDGGLDKEAISKAYFDGDFDQIQAPLEEFRRTAKNPKKEDLIFCYKFLSVIYASDPATKSKAESYMVQLLKLAPNIELLDLYVSDTIKNHFSRVKKEFQEEQRYKQQYDLVGNRIGPDTLAGGSPGPGSASSSSNPVPGKTESLPTRKKKASSAWIWWTAGAAATAAVVAGVLILGGEEDPKTEKSQEF